MKRFAGVATLALIACSGAALAQSTIVVPSEDMPRGRLERPAPGDLAPPGAGPSRAERPSPEQELGSSPRTQRGAQSEAPRAQEPQRGLGQREREQAQRERQGQPSDTRAQELRRGQAQQSGQDQAQRDRQDERNGRRDAEQAKPDARPAAPQSAQPQRPESRPNASETAQPRTGPSDTERSGAAAQRPDPAPLGTAGTEPTNRSSTAGTQPATGERNQAESRRIADTVRTGVERNEIKPVANLGVSVSVGAELPSRVQLQPVPNEIASIRPQYRDFRYTVSEREIVIVDPRSRRVVEVIAREGGRPGRVDVYTAFEQRRDIRRWRAPSTVVFKQGTVLPSDAPYYDLPTEVVERNPGWRGYQYVMTESEEVAIVEPRTHRVVDVVDKSSAQSASAAPATTGSTSGTTMAGGADSRHEIVRIIMHDAKPGDVQGVEGLRGAILPQDIVLRPVPAEASEQDRQLRGRHYALLGDDVLIVDPQSREIIDVIE